MRVAVLGSFPADPHEVHGGVEAVSRNLSTELAQLADTDGHVLSCNRGSGSS
jgi:hypothetical protein